MATTNYLTEQGLTTLVANTKAYVLAAVSAIGQSVTFTLPSSSWTSSSGVYTKQVTVQGVTANTIGDVGLSISATTAQRSAAQAANIALTGQTTNKLTFTATSVPTVDIPMVLNVIG